MRLLNLTLNNVGLFRGRHDFDLTPARPSNGSNRNLVVVKGANGVGKSTLFQSIGLALYGSLAAGDRVSRQAYNEFLYKRLHRSASGAISDDASVSLSFQYIQAGKPIRVHVDRKFERNGAIVNESLNILANGEPPDVDAADYQIWLNDLVPPQFSTLYFFDAERLDALSSVEQGGVALGEALRRLFGLDLVERLQTDLDHYVSNKGGGRKALDRLRREVAERQPAVDLLNTKLAKINGEADALAQKQRELESDLEKAKQHLAAEGGGYAERRQEMQERLVEINRETGELEDRLREISADLLPFALVPELCLSLGERLKQESKSRSLQAADELWQKRIAEVKEKVESEKFWEGVRVSAKDRKAITARLARTLKKTSSSGAVSKTTLVHNLSEPESEKLQGWIVEATESIPQQVAKIGERLHEFQEEKRHVEANIRRAPDDSVLSEIHVEVADLERRIEDVERQQKELSEQTGALKFQHSEAERLLRNATDELEKMLKGEKRLALAERSRATLRAYRDALTCQRVVALEKALEASFNAICRKEHLLGSVRISSDDFSVELRGADGHVLSLSEFSAGERQLYALALLWALRQVSGYQLPIAIDTPVARLDETHRNRIINDYIPAVSDQVLLFATDIEFGEETMAQAQHRLARVYHLDFQSTSEQTEVRCESFVPHILSLSEEELAFDV